MRHHTFVLSLAIFLFAAPVHAGVSARTWTIDGVERTGNVYTPDDASKKPEKGWPVVFVFHGHGRTAESVQQQYGIEAPWRGAIVVYLQGLPTPGLRTDKEGKKSGWVLRDAASNRDVKFYDEVLQRVLADDRGDAKRVYVTGGSNGGLFAYCLWMHRGETIRAVAPVSASAIEVKTSFNLTPKPALLVAGRKDTLVDFREQEETMEHVKSLKRLHRRRQTLGHRHRATVRIDQGRPHHPLETRRRPRAAEGNRAGGDGVFQGGRRKRRGEWEEPSELASRNVREDPVSKRKMDEQTWHEFLTAMGESFGESISPPVPFDSASAHECYNAVWSVLGEDVTPTTLAGLSEAQLAVLADGIGAYFESDPPTLAQVKLAIARTLHRWPTGSLCERE
jgi:poly(3-hydroxybutyrate) depolymerase